jgi:hypothetical protein
MEPYTMPRRLVFMGKITERRKLKTAAEFRVKATSLRTVAADLARGASRDNILAMADAWDAKADAAEADEASRRTWVGD